MCQYCQYVVRDCRTLPMFIVPIDSQIQRIKDNYTNIKYLSQINLDTLLGTISEACPKIEVPKSQQQDSFKQLDTSYKDVVCSKCQRKGHIVTNCWSVYTMYGKFIGWGGGTTTQSLLDKEEC